MWAEYPADRPVNDQGQRVTPSDLAVHRLSHQFLGPRCLCMLGNYPDSTHKEVVMVLLTQGPYGGEYVACCTMQRCGYFGELLETSISPVLLKARWLPSTPWAYPPYLGGTNKIFSKTLFVSLSKLQLLLLTCVDRAWQSQTWSNTLPKCRRWMRSSNSILQ